jgi:hypothetical protein
MCFSDKISLTIGVSGILASLYFYNNKNYYASIGLGYFALMEILQFLQYKVINECDNFYNKLLTNIGYIHICFQPLFFNLWLFEFTNKPNFTLIYMSFFAGLLLASRLFFVEDGELCDVKHEPLCGKVTCAFSGTHHIAWNLRLRSAGKYWFTPSIGLHFFMWVIPAISIFQIKPFMAMLLTGPYLGYFLTNNIHEQPAIWCYTVIAQMILTLFLVK